MRLADVVNGVWAITPEMHSEVQAIYARHMRGEKLSIPQIEAATGVKMQGTTRGYDVYNGVAVLPLEGVLSKKMNLMTQISGGTSTQIAANDLREALADSDVQAIILAIDSPGGTVDGTQELSDLIYASRDQKPIVALCEGLMASAAYWIGSAAAQVYMSSLTDAVGSVGVVQEHVDSSQADAKQGLKRTEVTAGKYKRIASNNAPLTIEGRQVMQDQVDHTYSVFVDDVARNRGVSVDTVLQDMADGRIFIGQQAIDAGLVDGVATLDTLIARAMAGDFSAAGNASQQQAATGASREAAAQPVTMQAESAGDAPKAVTNQEKTMDVQKLKAEHPDVAAALIDEGKALGATAERDRIKAVEAQSMPGHEALIDNLKFDGKTSGPEAAVQVLAAEKAKKGDRLAALRADAGAARVAAAAAPEPGEEKDPDDEEDDEQKDQEAEDLDRDPMKDGRGRKSKIANLNDARRVAADAREYQATMAAKGVKVSAAEAVAAVTKKEARHG